MKVKNREDRSAVPTLELDTSTAHPWRSALRLLSHGARHFDCSTVPAQGWSRELDSGSGGWVHGLGAEVWVGSGWNRGLGIELESGSRIRDSDKSGQGRESSQSNESSPTESMVDSIIQGLITEIGF
ncbi:hypothetical protein U1Q18_038914 [Sarracenia purpurea var. burkii]